MGRMIKERFINFIKEGFLHKNCLVTSVFRNSFLYLNHVYLNNVYTILHSFNIDILDMFEKKKIKLKINEINDMWKVGLINEILNMRDFRDYHIFSFDKSSMSHP